MKAVQRIREKEGRKAGNKRKKEKRKVEAVQRIREEGRLGTIGKKEKRKVEAVQRIREERRKECWEQK